MYILMESRLSKFKCLVFKHTFWLKDDPVKKNQ